QPPCTDKGYADVVRKGRFYSAIIHHSAGSSDTCWDCPLLAPPKTFAPAGQGRPRKRQRRRKKIDQYFRGANRPRRQTTIIIVKAIYKYCSNTMLAKEIHVASLKKKTAFSACDVFQRSFPCPAGKQRR